MMEKV